MTLTQGRLKELLHYDKMTGFFYWLDTRHNGAKVGSVAGGVSRGERDGYWRIRVDGKKYRAHRLAFVYMTGNWPQGLVDHKDGSKVNNAWRNLRQASNGQNKANGKAYRNNVVGLKGVTAKGKKFQARIRKNNELVHLGTFETALAAHEAYRFAAKQLHGEFARAA